MATRTDATAAPTPGSQVATWAPVAAIVVVHLALLVVAPEGPALPTLVAVEGGLLVAAVAADRRASSYPPRASAALVAAWVLLAGGVWAASRSVDPVALALALAVTVALATYALHRYELVALGLVEVADDRDTDASAAGDGTGAADRETTDDGSPDSGDRVDGRPIDPSDGSGGGDG